MADQFCNERLEELVKLVQLQENFMLTFCVLNLVCTVVAVVENLLVIRALWKASSIPNNLKKLFMSLAYSDLAMALFGQFTLGVIIAVMLKMAAPGNENVHALCPTVLTVYYFVLTVLGCASFLNVTAIAVDRLLAISLHLRYQELITSRRVIIALASLWLTSSPIATLYEILPNPSNTVIAIIEVVGLLCTTVAYICIYRVITYHRNQMHLQQPNAQEMNLRRETKSAFNALFVYIVFAACYLPDLCALILLITDRMRISFLVAKIVTVFLVFLNSLLNPLLYCWRYREIREITINTGKKLLRVN